MCYVESQYFESEDGSKITNQDGILVFESSDKRIDKFYVPFVLNIQTAMASVDEFAGNQYFISPEHGQNVTTGDRFIEKYLKPFILHIVHHGA